MYSTEFPQLSPKFSTGCLEFSTGFDAGIRVSRISLDFSGRANCFSGKQLLHKVM